MVSLNRRVHACPSSETQAYQHCSNSSHALSRPGIVAQELVLILWGIFFVAIHNGPQYKGRDLIQAVREGAQNAVKGATSIASTVGTRQDSGTSSLSESKEEVEVVPAWDSFSGITSEVIILPYLGREGDETHRNVA